MGDVLSYIDAALESSRLNLARIEALTAHAASEARADIAERAAVIERLRNLETGFGRVRVTLEAAE